MSLSQLSRSPCLKLQCGDQSCVACVHLNFLNLIAAVHLSLLDGATAYRHSGVLPAKDPLNQSGHSIDMTQLHPLLACTPSHSPLQPSFIRRC